MQRYYYSDSITTFLKKDEETILGSLLAANEYPLEMTQRDAWLAEIQILKSVLGPYQDAGQVYFEFSIPRLGRRIDVVVIVQSVIFVLEFKVNEREFTSSAADQVCDYALDLKNFHETSHELPIAPVLIATEAKASTLPVEVTTYHDQTLVPIRTNSSGLASVIQTVLKVVGGKTIAPAQWESGRYCPTPTIIEASGWPGLTCSETPVRHTATCHSFPDTQTPVRQRPSTKLRFVVYRPHRAHSLPHHRD